MGPLDILLWLLYTLMLLPIWAALFTFFSPTPIRDAENTEQKDH